MTFQSSFEVVHQTRTYLVLNYLCSVFAKYREVNTWKEKKRYVGPL